MIRRRPLLAGLALAPSVARAGAQGADKRGLAAGCLAAIQAAMAALPPGPGLLNSFVVETGPALADFDRTQADAAYVYDNALAGLALLAGGDRAGAARIGDALALALAHDRFYRDGRLRNAYQAGAMTAPARLPGWWDAGAGQWREDPYQVGSQTGPLAWAMLLWAALGNQAPAARAAFWLNDRLRTKSGYYGGFHGFEPAPLPLIWQSTEQNTDLAVAFARIGRAEDAGHAAGFVQAMFDPAKNLFNAGLTPQGAVNPLLAADAGTWPTLAGLGDAAAATNAIARLQHGAGIGFSDASAGICAGICAGIWLEGTAFASLVLAGQNPGLAAQFTATLAANVAPGGYVMATTAPVLATGLTTGPALRPGVAPENFYYFRRPALAPTAWAVLAALDVNPLAR